MLGKNLKSGRAGVSAEAFSEGWVPDIGKKMRFLGVAKPNVSKHWKYPAVHTCAGVNSLRFVE